MNDSYLSDSARLIEETAALRNAIVNITLAWSGVETSLALVLKACAEPQGTGDIAFAIFYSLASADARLGVVDAAFTTLIQKSPHEDDILSVWKPLTDSINKRKRVRNAVAHGQIVTSCIHGKNHVRLAPQIFDWKRMIPRTRIRQPVGLKAADIDHCTSVMGKISNIIPRFGGIADHIHKGEHASLPGIIQQLRDHLKTIEAPKGDLSALTP